MVFGLVLIVVTACSVGITPSSDTVPEDPQDPGRLERAYVACFKDNGVDARLVEGGGIHFDSGGNLSPEESQALIETCQRQLEEMGLRIEPEVDDDSLKARYEEISAVRTCLIDHGHPAPEIVSLEAYLEDPSAQANPYDSIMADPNLDGSDLRRIVEACPDPGGRVVISE